jgi:hypothetical protein
MNKITHKDIQDILNIDIDNELKLKIDAFDLRWERLNQLERDLYLNDVINVLLSDIRKSGQHRITEWENGWNENLELFIKSKNPNDLIPKYHGKRTLLKWKGDIIKPLIENFDYKIHICFVDAILRYYLKDCSNIFEFGCGPAYHLIRLNQWNNKVKYHGADWTKSSQNIIKSINQKLDLNINSSNFDFFNPDYSLDIPKDTGIYTVAALEQVGENFKDFINFLINKKPSICVHLEPIDELLDENNLIDNLTIKYFRKRNYLNGFLSFLEKLEKNNIIEIVKKQRIYSGSYFIEGHSLIVWKIK